MRAATYLDPRPPLEPPFAPTIPAMLRWLADRYEEREAQVRGSDRISFRALEQKSARMARGLMARGMGKGSRIALLMPNGPDFTVAFMAVARIGALVAPLSTFYQARELAAVLRQGDFQVLLTAEKYLRHDYLSRLEQALPSLPDQAAGALALPEAPLLRSILVWGDCDRGWAESGPSALDEAVARYPRIDGAILAEVEACVVPADLLCVIFTSGSTAEPKAVVHSHGAMLRHGWQKAHGYWNMGEGDRIIGPRPHFWIAGLAATLFQSLLTGCCLLDPDATSSAATLNLIETEGVTGACGDLNWLFSLCCDPVIEAAGYKAIMPSFETVAFAVRTASGGLRYLNPVRARRDPHPAQIPRELLARPYGMTETLSSHTTLPAGEHLPPHRAGYCGRPMPGVKMKIVDPDTRRPVAPGVVGEVLIGGYCLMTGMYKKEPSEIFTEDGYYPTGDLVSMDEDGYVLFQSRLGDMIKINGANVAPLEVEYCLNAIAQVERCAVLGLAALGEEVMLVAAVEVQQPECFREAAVIGELRTQLSSYKVPRRIFAMEPGSMPLTGSNKVRKAELAAQLSDMLRDEQDAAKP